MSDDLPPDHPLVNPELHRRVYKALSAVAEEERANFDPIKRPVRDILARERAERQKVIAEHQAEKDAEGSNGSKPGD